MSRSNNSKYLIKDLNDVSLSQTLSLLKQFVEVSLARILLHHIQIGVIKVNILCSQDIWVTEIENVIDDSC